MTVLCLQKQKCLHISLRNFLLIDSAIFQIDFNWPMANLDRLQKNKSGNKFGKK